MRLGYSGGMTGLINSAETLQQLRGVLGEYEQRAFFGANGAATAYKEAAKSVVNFQLRRPAMLVADANDVGKILNFLDKEWYEAENAESVETREDLLAELGDMGFFVLLTGMLHWDKLEGSQRDFVQRALGWAEDKARENKINLSEAIVYAAEVKDPKNYREEFYGLRKEERVEETFHRVEKIGKLHRKIRSKLNGEWSETKDLLTTLATHWLNGSRQDDETIGQIEELFLLADIDILSYAYDPDVK